jgi:hypothetical protein
VFLCRSFIQQQSVTTIDFERGKAVEILQPSFAREKKKQNTPSKKYMRGVKFALVWLVLSILIMITAAIWLVFVVVDKDCYSSGWYLASVSCASVFLVTALAIVAANIVLVVRARKNGAAIIDL